MKTPKMQVEKGILMHIEYTLPETNSSHLKMSGAMFVSGRVYTFCFLDKPEP